VIKKLCGSGHNGRKHTLNCAKNIAKLNNGKCLSKVYINDREHLIWECKYNHRWTANLTNVLHNRRWCPNCGGSKRKTIKDAQEVAISRNGLCLSRQYKNNRENLLWKCKKGHVWEASLHNIKDGKNWCPMCSNKRSKKQEELFNILKEIFPNYTIEYNYNKFEWLKTNNRGKLEIDIFIKNINVAIEYDGRQHFEPVMFGSLTYEQAQLELKKTKRRDRTKNMLISKHSGDVSFLIRFSYKNKITKDAVLSTLQKHGIKCPR